MQQKELAILLDISPAMVSRLAKKGMPTDTLEHAQRWRKRHLEPGRVKGIRADTIKPKPPVRPVHEKLPPASTLVVAGARVTSLEAAGDLIDGALSRGNQTETARRIMQLRLMFRKSDAIEDESARLTVRVWLALLEYMLHPDAEIRLAPNMGEYLSAGECGARLGAGVAWAAHTVLFECCDHYDIAINGWPDDEGEPDD